MDPRERVLRAAAQLFAELGYRGATTRRIAREAGVNEVTLFRQFGSKQELIRSAIRHAARVGEGVTLPARPRRPRQELLRWSEAQLERLHERRSMIRMCMGESAERPEVVSAATAAPVRVKAELRAYLLRLRSGGLADRDFDVDAASAMLMGALFTDAMGRDLMPESYPYPRDEAAARYVDLFLRAIGGRGAGGSPTRQTSGRK
jgi:AcrR family transcriptional regulator